MEMCSFVKERKDKKTSSLFFFSPSLSLCVLEGDESSLVSSHTHTQRQSIIVLVVALLCLFQSRGLLLVFDIVAVVVAVHHLLAVHPALL